MRIFYRIFTILTFLCCFVFGESFSEEFFKIKNADERKEEFVRILTPLIEEANENILKERETVDLFFQKLESDGLDSIGNNERLVVEAIAKKYKIDSIENKKLFEKRVAPVPTSLAIAQAAVESGWGTSRFTREANNIYGQWIWTNNDELGMIPKKREIGKNHRVRIFSTLQDAVNSYLLNLNCHNAYENFRYLRLNKGDAFSGIDAANTMVNYSEIREKYVKILKDIIKTNKLLKLDNSYRELVQNSNTKSLHPLS